MWIMVLFACGFFLSYFFRNVNSLIYPDLIGELGFSAVQMGLLTAVYALSGAFLQIPIGVLLDTRDPRRVQFGFLLLGAVGALIFSLSSSFLALIIARILVGIALSGGLMAAVKSVTVWAPKEKHIFFSGIVMAIGGLGAVMATLPTQLMLSVWGWRTIFAGMSVSLVLIAVLTRYGNKAAFQLPQCNVSFGSLILSSFKIYTIPSFWRCISVSVIANAFYMGMLGIWLSAWMMDFAGLSRPETAVALLAAALSMSIGSFFFSWLSGWARTALKWPPLFFCAIVLIFFLASQLLLAFSDWNPYFLGALFGFSGGVTAVKYSIVAQTVEDTLSARATTCFNLVLFICLFLVQWGIGAFLDLFPREQGHFSRQSYQWMLGILVLLQTPGVLIGLFSYRSDCTSK